MAFVIFQNTGKFKSDLKSWSRKPEVERTWSNMKSHFRDTLQDARDVEDAPVGQTFDQANMINEVLDGVCAIVRNQAAVAMPQSSPKYHPANTNFRNPPQPFAQELPSQQFASEQTVNMSYEMPPSYNYANQVQQGPSPPLVLQNNQPHNN